MLILKKNKRGSDPLVRGLRGVRPNKNFILLKHIKPNNIENESETNDPKS